MGYFEKYISQFRWRLLLLFLTDDALAALGWLVANRLLHINGWGELAAVVLPPLLFLAFMPLIVSSLTRPTKMLWQAILHLTPATSNNVPAPQPATLKIGRAMVIDLISQIHQLTTVVQNVSETSHKSDLSANFIASSLPLPLFVLNKEDVIVYVNSTTAQYLHRPVSDLVGQNIYTVLDMSFISDDTLGNWLKLTKDKTATSNHRWERVRIGLPGQTDSLQFDLAAYYNKDNPLGYETMLILFDHTEVYAQDDQAMSFVSLAVHELRTPLTLLRGYIEVFDDELGPTLNSELQDFMEKMNASAEQLTYFVDNILNVAKIEDNQLTLQLHEANWKELIDSVVHDLSLRAKVRGITIKTEIAADLPPVGVDRYSIYEVLANLLDNAIKYSKGTSEIYVTASLNVDGLVETSVKDFGLGIDINVIPHIFDKFYRNHRNRSQIGGTGLGLYLARTIVEAHGGTIWVNSKVDEGSTFTFTVLPFNQVGRTGEANPSGVTRNAHGWIKNHSLLR